MKKQISNLGKLLKKTEQIQINGGRKQCKPPGSRECIDYGQHCAEIECVWDPREV